MLPIGPSTTAQCLRARSCAHGTVEPLFSCATTLHSLMAPLFSLSRAIRLVAFITLRVAHIVLRSCYHTILIYLSFRASDKLF